MGHCVWAGDPVQLGGSRRAVQTAGIPHLEQESVPQPIVSKGNVCACMRACMHLCVATH